MEMFNDLRSEPAIRDQYQFWFYLYPTGQPFWFSAAQMREDLIHARQTLDPEMRDLALDQTVLVGHSMGGLVSKLQTVNSGEDFWRTVSDRPFTSLKAEPATIDTLSRTLYFQPNPSVRRVVTIGTPHRGSEFANDATRWLSRRLIGISGSFRMKRQDLLRDNPGVFREGAILSIETSIDSLAPDSPFLPVLLSAQKGPWVSYHNIVGRIPSEGVVWRLTGDGDGVVPQTCAELGPELVESQVVIPADHVNVHRHPLAIREVRRILLEHLEVLRTQPGARPVSLPAAQPVAALPPPIAAQNGL
jgi:hypothetical protein